MCIFKKNNKTFKLEQLSQTCLCCILLHECSLKLQIMHEKVRIQSENKIYYFFVSNTTSNQQKQPWYINLSNPRKVSQLLRTHFQTIHVFKRSTHSSTSKNIIFFNVQNLNEVLTFINSQKKHTHH